MSKFTTLVKTTITPIALCLTLTIAAPALAKKGHHQGHDGMRQILSELSLTDTQKQDIRHISKQSREYRGLFSSDVTFLKEELRSLVQTTEWDQTAVESAITQRQTLMQTKALQRAINKNQVWNLLTETQQSEFLVLFDTLKAERKEKGHESRNNGKRKSNKLRHLDLSKAQLVAVRDLKNASKARGKEIKTTLKTYKQAEHLLLHNTDFNADVWLSLNNKFQADFLAMAVLKAKTKHDIWNQLTPDQQAMALEKVKNKNGKHGRKSKNHHK
jgi:protein CpxP